MDGDNKYDAGDHGLQDAEKGVVFISFPPVLHLHLMRFQYDPALDLSVKYNERFEFNEHINLDDYLHEKNEQNPADYTLHAVLVHSGDNYAGHYVVYINTNGVGKWCKFNDDVVSNCTRFDAIEQNYGGIDEKLNTVELRSYSAYMLVYIRDSELPNVLREIRKEDVPSELGSHVLRERRIEGIRNSDYIKAYSLMVVNVVLEESFETHHTLNLYDINKVHTHAFLLKKTKLLRDLVKLLSTAFCIPPNHMRLWPIKVRQHYSPRPKYLQHSKSMLEPLSYFAKDRNSWTIFLELFMPNLLITEMPKYTVERDAQVFFKYYDPIKKLIIYCGLAYYSFELKFIDLLPDMKAMVDLPADTELTIYEQQGAFSISKIDHEHTLEYIFDVIF